MTMPFYFFISPYHILHTKYDIRIRYLLYESKREKAGIFQKNVRYTAIFTAENAEYAE